MSFIEICDVHTGKFILFPAPAEMVCIGRYRSHHVVAVFKDGRVDHNDWTLRFLDGYTGPTVSRWDRVLHIESGQTSHHEEFLEKFAGYRILSFEDWVPAQNFTALQQKPPFISFQQFVANHITSQISSIFHELEPLNDDLIVHILAGTDYFQDLENQKRLVDRIMPYARFLLAENCDCNVFLNYKGFWYNTAIVLPEFEQASRTKNAKERAKLFSVESRIINRCRFTMIVKRATNICIAMRELNIDAL